MRRRPGGRVDARVAQLTRDWCGARGGDSRSNKLAVEALKGLLTHVVKRDVFNRDDAPL